MFRSIPAGASAFALALVLLDASPAFSACGDFNGDGVLSMTDALGIMNVAAGAAECALIVCDVDDSGAVSATDALIVQKIAVGQSIVLNCPAGDAGWYPSVGARPDFRIMADQDFRVHPGRPRLYFRQQDIDWLVARGQGPFAEQWAELEWMAASMASTNPAGGIATDDVKGWFGQKGQAVALMALLTDDDAYTEWAVEWAKALGRKSMPGPNDDTPLRARTERLAVVYDWLHDRMSGSDRNEIRDALIRYVEALSQIDYMQEPSYISGHSRWGYSVLGMALIALHGDYSDPFDLLEQCRNHLAYGFYPAQAWIAENGGYHMGWAYSSTYTNVDLPYLVWTVGTNDILLDDWMVATADWYLYGMRGDDTFEPSGDAYNVDLKLGAVSAIYAAGVGKNGPARWFVENKLAENDEPFLRLLLLDPAVPAESPDSLPPAKHFHNAGVVIARDGWGSDTTQMTFKSSSFYSSNHHHRDENTFTLHYRSPLAIDSGFYDEPGSDHFKNYFTRTIAHNGIVVRDPDDVVVRFGEVLSNDGGQVFGDEPDTLDDILPGGHASLDGIVRYEGRDRFTYAFGDATRAYDPQHVDLAQREIVYLRETEDPHPVVVVFDRVKSTSPDLEKRFLLHTVSEPTLNGSRMVSFLDSVRLTSMTLYPEDADLSLVGGAGHAFFVDGQNYPIGSSGWDAAEAIGVHPGSWRLEVAPGQPASQDYFLHALFVDDVGAPVVASDEALLIDSSDAIGMQFNGDEVDDWVVVFPRSPAGVTRVDYEVRRGGLHRHLVTGFDPYEPVTFSVDGEVRGSVDAGRGGCAGFVVSADAGQTVTVRH